MSSTFVADTPEDHKSDNTLIIIVNNDGTISVDQETLQNILANQQNTAVSVVRVGGPSQDDSSQESNGTNESENDGNPHVNLTVEGFYPPSAVMPEETGVVDHLATPSPGIPAPAVPRAISPASTVAPPMAPPVDLVAEMVSPTAPPSVASAGIGNVPPPSSAEGESLDPFLEMDPEQLERLETALQSEQAKQILGENVTAMLDMLSVEEEASSQLKDSILMDHCYTNRSPATAPPPPPPPPPPSTATLATHQFSAGSGRDDGGLLLHQADHIQQVVPAGMGPPTIQTVIRGRGRGGRPGRPRRDTSSTRGITTASLRGINRGGLSRGVKIQRGGTIVSGTGAGNMIMVQQIKQITPPLGAGNSATGNATLVPVVRPLVLTSGTTQISGGTVVRAPIAGQVQKQIITVPQGARLVAVQSKSSVDASGQPTVVLTNAAGQVVQTQSIQGAISVQSQLANANNAKVVVAKMPVLPPQLLGAQSTTLPLSEQPSQHLQKEDESDFTDFPREASEESESEESDVGSDDEYKDPSVGDRRRGRGGKNRGRFGRGARSRGGFRVYDASRGQRGARRGRGRGFAKLEDVDRVKKLDAEMAGFVAAMEKSPERASVPEKSNPVENREKGSKKEEVAAPEVSPGEGAKKKLMKVYGKSIKKMLGGEEVQVKSESVVVKDKTEKSSVPPITPEKKSPVQKHSLKRHSPEIPSVTTVATLVSNSAPVVTTPVIGDVRKNYPKRENRKPPAHLAEALGPALFSTPDIIRRVSTGPDHKPVPGSPVEEKEVKPAIATSPTELVAEEKLPVVGPENFEKDMSVPPPEAMEENAGAVLDPFQSNVLNTAEDVLDQSLLLPLESSEEKTIDKSSLILKIVQEPTPLALESVKPKTQPQPTQSPPVTKVIPTKVLTPTAAKRSSRRRNSSGTQQNEATPKKENKLVSVSSAKDKKRGEDNKQKGRRRSSEIEEEEDDDDVPSSDDESWNSEDDPDRLWCICKKPHNNRFMICCDVCEDWFHGKCVGVTKAMGQQMENKGLEWSCPNCSKKKENSEKDSKKVNSLQGKEKDQKKARENKKDSNLDKTIEAAFHEVKDTFGECLGAGTSLKESSAEEQVMYCIVCKKEARSSSIYCSDACILKHAQESLNVINRERASVPGSANGSGGKEAIQEQAPATSQTARGAETSHSGHPNSTPNQSQRPRPDARVIVFERKSGRLLAGPNAPTAGTLKSWLKDNPTFEVVRPGTSPNTKFYTAKLAGGKITAAQPSKTLQKPAIQSVKSPSCTTTTTTTPVPCKQASQKNNVSQKPILVQQKLPFTSVKNTVAQPKSAAAAASNAPAATSPTLKVMSPKIQKGPIVVPAQPQKVPGKASPKNTNMSAKGAAKGPAVTAVTPSSKIPLSPTNKTALPTVVSKAPATSTVKENAKAQAEKTPAKKVEVKRQSSSSEIVKKEEEKEKPSGPEPIRLNIRKTLQELLQARIQECPDLQVSEEEVHNIAVNIEEEMHLFFRDTGLKYKSKYRSLVFNIKDRKNLTLFRKIADKSLTPHQLVRLSPEELASQELALWREREAKHQLEMIKKNELDLMSQAKTYVMKTHKGEQVIETDESLKVEVPELVDPSTVPDLVSPLNNSVSSTVEDSELDKGKCKLKDKDSKEKCNKEDKEHGRDREKSRHDEKRRDKGEKSKREDRDRRDSHHDRHDRDRRKDSRERDKSKTNSREKHKSKRDDRHRDSKSSNSSRNTSSCRKDKKEEEVKKEETKKESDQPEIREEEIEKEPEKNNTKEEAQEEPDLKQKIIPYSKEFQEDSDLSDREPSSTVIIKTPDINTEELEKNVCATVWKGFVNMPDVAKFFTTVQVVSGDPQNLCSDLPDTVDIVGRISPDTVWDYISKMKKTGTKEILVIRLTAASDEEKIPYITLYTYLNTRGRLGVVGNVSSMIKDFYIMPLASHLPVPQILLPLDGPGFEDYRPHLLIGILVRARRKRLAPENEYVAKMPKRIVPPPVSNEPVERSYTPPLPSSGTDAGSLTPPLYNTFYPPASGDSYTPPSSPQGFLAGPSFNSKSSEQRLSRIDDESLLDEYRLPDKPMPEKKPLASRVGQYGDDEDDDDDAPYSPGGSDDNMESSEENILLTPKNPVELQRKVEELNRKIEEQKQQIQSISSAIVASDPSVATLGAVSDSLKANYMLGSSSGEVTGAEEGDENEAYSPSRSFTPPATSIPFIGPADASTTPVFSKLTSNINLPSNLHEILATIKKQESDKAAGTKGINLKSDPIVQNYAQATELESSQPKSPTEEFEASTFTAVGTSGCTSSSSSSVLQSASSALLSLSTPVVHPLASGGSIVSTSVTAIVVEAKVNRDPRQRGSEILNKTPGTTLSSLSDDDLIKKALEMERELTESKIKPSDSSAVNVSTLQQPLPPGVDSLPPVTATAPPIKAVKSVPPSQPLPPGVEDEEYPSYSSFGVTSQSTAMSPVNIPVPPMAPTNKYGVRSPNSPAGYRVQHPYPGANFNMGSPRGPPPGPGYSSSFPPPPPPPGGYPTSADDGGSAPTSTGKRKYSDNEGEDSAMKRDRSDSSPPAGGREAWDSKVPVPVRGRFSGRGRGFGRGAPPVQRGFIRMRGGMNRPPIAPPTPHTPHPPPPASSRSRWDTKDDRKRPSRYESNRSDWEPHNKDIDDKYRERARESRHRDRSRERDGKTSSSLRSHSTRSSRSRDSEKSTDSP